MSDPWEELRKKRAGHTPNADGDASGSSEGKGMWRSFDAAELQLQGQHLGVRLLFGVTVGSIVGATTGIIDTMKDAASKTRKGTKMNVMNTQTLKTTMHASAQGALVFGGFYGLYQVVKKGMEMNRGKKDVWNTVAAVAVSLAPLTNSIIFRRNVGYGVLLIGMDQLHEYGVL